MIDDDPWQLEALKIFLEPEHDITLNTFTSPGEAVEGILRGDYDCVVTDYRMQGIDGISFLRIIRKLTQVPVLVYTMVDDPELENNAKQEGADKLILKGADYTSIKIVTDEIRKQVRARDQTLMEHSGVEGGSGTGHARATFSAA